MFGFGKGIDQKKMQALMKQIGVSQQEIDSKKVIIEKEDGKIIIENPVVTKISFQGQESFQISGEIKEEIFGFSEEDIETVMKKTGVKREKAIEALKNSSGDLAKAILELS
jgi:nascent polypeptide-associated complex subunit alpha